MTPAEVTDRPEKQGARFERTFADLIERLINEIDGLTLTEVISQPSGAQGGRDLQVKWRNATGEERFWHFECKSTAGPILPTKEIGDKLLQEFVAPHAIDVWCVALAEAEPSKDIDDLLNTDRPGFRFAVAVLSRRRGSLKWLYACYPDLYRDQYGEPPPTLTKGERERYIEAFHEWLEERSQERPSTQLPDGWEMVSTQALTKELSDPKLGHKYLRGLTVTCPWEAISMGWTVPRQSTEATLETTLSGADLGFSHRWLISAGGEGKSTVLRRLAKAALERLTYTYVLWADDLQAAEVPLDWLEALPEGSSVLLCVDGSALFGGLGTGIAASERLADAGVRVVTILADRGNRWQSNRARLIPPRSGNAPVKLKPLSAKEQGKLLELLREQGLLYASPSAGAAALATAAASAREDGNRGRWDSWLVPTVMQLTDPRKRPFARILASVLEELRDTDEIPSLRLLLAIALLDTAGPALPKEIATRLLGSNQALTSATELLDSEMEKQFDAPSEISRHAVERYRTHGSAVSDGFVKAASRDESLRNWLVEVSGELPALMGPEYDKRTALRSDRFQLLDSATNYLDGEIRETEAAVALLVAWTNLDPVGFATWTRLGNAYTHWVQREVSKRDASRTDLLRRADAARSAFRNSLKLAAEVLGKQPVPAPYLNYNLATEQRVTYHSWAALEATVGTRHTTSIGGEDDLILATYLALLGFHPHPDLPRSCGLLARVMVNLDQKALAAPFVGCLRTIGGGDKNPVVKRTAPVLAAAKIEIPTGGVELLPPALQDVIDTVIAPRWDLVKTVSDGKPPQKLLETSLDVLLAELPS